MEGNVVLVCARDGQRRNSLAATNQPHCVEPLIVFEVDGNHDSMLRPPLVDQTARILLAAIADENFVTE